MNKNHDRKEKRQNNDKMEQHKYIVQLEQQIYKMKQEQNNTRESAAERPFIQTHLFMDLYDMNIRA
jgi:hypothetical protein